MTEATEIIAAARESVSTVFRHILPGILIIMVGAVSKPSLLPEGFDMYNTASLVIVGVIALAIGNVWYVFHRYFALQILDFFAYDRRWKGQPSRTAELQYRVDTGKHVRRFFRALPKNSAMARHIRDRFSSLNLMYIVSEALIIFTFFSDDTSSFRQYSYLTYGIGVVGLVAATCQYSIARTIDEQFADLGSRDSVPPDKTAGRAVLEVEWRECTRGDTLAAAPQGVASPERQDTIEGAQPGDDPAVQE